MLHKILHQGKGWRSSQDTGPLGLKSGPQTCSRNQGARVGVVIHVDGTTPGGRGHGLINSPGTAVWIARHSALYLQPQLFVCGAVEGQLPWLSVAVEGEMFPRWMYSMLGPQFGKTLKSLGGDTGCQLWL